MVIKILGDEIGLWTNSHTVILQMVFMMVSLSGFLEPIPWLDQNKQQSKGILPELCIWQTWLSIKQA